MELVTTQLQSGLFLALLLSAAPLLASLATGFVVSVLQAATQIHDQTLSFVPKVISVGLVLMVGGAWMTNELCDYFVQTMSVMAKLGRYPW